MPKHDSMAAKMRAMCEQEYLKSASESQATEYAGLATRDKVRVLRAYIKSAGGDAEWKQLALSILKNE